MKRTEVLILLVYLIYCSLALLDSEPRLQLTVQFGYFIYAYKILRGLGPETIRTLNRYIALIGSAFIFIHTISIAQAAMTGNIMGAATNVFGFVIYQSHLTYALNLILILVCVNRSLSHLPILKFIIISSVMLIEFVLLRRTAFGLFLIFLFLFERRFMIWIVLSTFASAILFSEITVRAMEIFNNIERLIQFSDGADARTNTWRASLNYLNEIGTVFLGNGLHNYSHNFFLETMTTHGIIIAVVFFATVAYFMGTMVGKLGISNRHSLLAFAFVVVDWNVNANLYQPYYSALFAFFLVSSTVFSGKKNDT